MHGACAYFVLPVLLPLVMVISNANGNIYRTASRRNTPARCSSPNLLPGPRYSRRLPIGQADLPCLSSLNMPRESRNQTRRAERRSAPGRAPLAPRQRAKSWRQGKELAISSTEETEHLRDLRVRALSPTEETEPPTARCQRVPGFARYNAGRRNRSLDFLDPKVRDLLEVDLAPFG